MWRLPCRNVAHGRLWSRSSTTCPAHELTHGETTISSSQSCVPGTASRAGRASNSTARASSPANEERFTEFASVKPRRRRSRGAIGRPSPWGSSACTSPRLPRHDGCSPNDRRNGADNVAPRVHEIKRQGLRSSARRAGNSVRSLPTTVPSAVVLGVARIRSARIVPGRSSSKRMHRPRRFPLGGFGASHVQPAYDSFTDGKVAAGERVFLDEYVSAEPAREPVLRGRLHRILLNDCRRIVRPQGQPGSADQLRSVAGWNRPRRLAPPSRARLVRSANHAIRPMTMATRRSRCAKALGFRAIEDSRG
jgi:hypothetical protein